MFLKVVRAILGNSRIMAIYRGEPYIGSSLYGDPTEPGRMLIHDLNSGA